MATKNKKKSSKTSQSKKPAAKRKAAKSKVKSKAASKAVAAKKPSKNKSGARARTSGGRGRVAGRNEEVQTVDYQPRGLGSRSAGQSGDLQGLSDAAEAESESVDELLEEGNAFEAEVVKGVEDVGDADEGPIRTREVPEDDVPEEYLSDEDEDGPSPRGKRLP